MPVKRLKMPPSPVTPANALFPNGTKEAEMIDSDQHFDAWNPGLTSEIPPRLLNDVTLFRAENSYVSYRDAKEAADF